MLKAIVIAACLKPQSSGWCWVGSSYVLRLTAFQYKKRRKIVQLSPAQGFKEDILRIGIYQDRFCMLFSHISAEDNP